MRNDGNGKFEDKTTAFPFVKGTALDAVTTAMRGDTAARDVAVSYSDRPGTLYRDMLNGEFAASDLPVLPPGAKALAAVDFDHDGLIDLVSFAPKKQPGRRRPNPLAFEPISTETCGRTMPFWREMVPSTFCSTPIWRSAG
jgi:hypothetical protein